MRDWPGLKPSILKPEDPKDSIIKLRSQLATIDSYLRDSAAAVRRLSDGVPAQTSTIVSISGVTDHGDLSGLSDDDHTQYAKLSGRTNDDQVWKSGGTTFVQIDSTNTKTIHTNGNTVLTVKGDSIVQTDAISASTLDVRGDAGWTLGTGSNTLMVHGQSSDLAQPVVAIRSNASQTGNIMEWQTSAGSQLAYIDKDGNASFAAGSNTWKIVGKTSDETITSDSTLSNDAVLLFPVAASTKYAFRFMVFFSSGGSEDFQFTVTCPSAPTAFRFTHQSFATGGSFVAGIESTSGAANSVLGTGGNGYVVIEGFLQNGANSGNVTLQWAQTSSGGSDTTVYAGSTVQYKSL